MAFLDVEAMLAQENKSNNVKEVGIYISFCGSASYKSSTGMAFEAGQNKFGTQLSITPCVFHISPDFKPWSLKIPISDGYHESLCIDLCHL